MWYPPPNLMRKIVASGVLPLAAFHLDWEHCKGGVAHRETSPFEVKGVEWQRRAGVWDARLPSLLDPPICCSTLADDDHDGTLSAGHASLPAALARPADKTASNSPVHPRGVKEERGTVQTPPRHSAELSPP